MKTARADFLVEHLDLPQATGVPTARWEYFQLAHLNDDSRFRIENKSRQIAWSWLIAAEAVADAILNKQSSLFVSINKSEAAEKIRYAKDVLASLQGISIPKLVKDNELSIEFTNRTRLISLPSRAPRGKARMNVYLDEYAHVTKDRSIQRGAMSVTSKGGRLRIGSSPMGATGVFWEIFTESIRAYPNFKRKSTPWWEIYAFCIDPQVARKLAPNMATAQRVARFGRETIKILFANMPLEDFQQEHECLFVDETRSWITFEEIRAVQEVNLLCRLVSGVDAAITAIDALAHDCATGRAEMVLGAGIDVGRTRNTTEIYFVGVSTTYTYPLRLSITLDNCEFNQQYAVIAYACQQLPLLGCLIDRNGLGMNLSENLSIDYPGLVIGVDFTNRSKALWARDAKMLIQQRRTPLPPDRDLAYQIHSIKRKITASANLVFDAERNQKHHADKFWAWALALVVASQPFNFETAQETKESTEEETVRISSY